MATLSFALHPAQQKIWNSLARFKAVVAGRRFGKTHLMCAWLLCKALEQRNQKGYELTYEHEVLYIAPTFAQAQRMFWPKLKKMAEPVTAKTLENTGVLYLTNGRVIRLHGMDDPDSARGGACAAVGFDEYADMPERAWSEVIRPRLIDVEGEAMFIGTPKGKNHFYKLFAQALDCDNGAWEAFNFTSHDNPLLKPGELEDITKDLSSDQLRQEVEASFTANEGQVFKRDWFKTTTEEPSEGNWYIAVDLAGFKKEGASKKDMRRLDETAIAIVKNHSKGWYVKDIVHGQWDTRRTALEILNAAKSVGAQRVGVEQGALSNAVEPYLRDVMRQYGRYLDIVPLRHGNQRKADRITWALQGRLEKGRVQFAEGEYFQRLCDQAMDFPDTRAKDDLLDALAYVDQIATPFVFNNYEERPYQPLDAYAGY